MAAITFRNMPVRKPGADLLRVGAGHIRDLAVEVLVATPHGVAHVRVVAGGVRLHLHHQLGPVGQ